MAFAEFVEGGSLAEWIKEGKVSDLKQALDIAIQVAWGMKYIHSKGLIHCNLKPSNVLMTEAGTAKISGFVLARYTVPTGIDAAGQTSFGYQVSVGAGTPGYAAPEQLTSGQMVDARADIFAFGVVLWRMLGGRLSWIEQYGLGEALHRGVMARRAVKHFLEQGEPGPLPPALADLILRCLEPEPEDRWPDFATLIGQLRELYEQLTREAYARLEPQEAELLADSLNNRALSLMDLGRTAEAEAAWQRALASDAHHLESVYNWGLLRWRTGRMDDTALARDLRESATSSEPWRAAVLAAQVELESDDCQAAIELLNPLEGEDARRAEVQRLLRRARELLPTSRCCLRTFEGHTSSVASVFLSADGRYALSGSWDNTLRLWEVCSGHCLRTFEGHTHVVTSVFLSADGRYALSGSRDNTLKLWEVSSGHCLRTFEGHTHWVTSVFLSADGRYALSGSWDKTIKLWEVSSGHCLRTFEGHTAVCHIRFPECGRPLRPVGKQGQDAEAVGGQQRPMPADLRRTHQYGHIRFPECGRPLRPVGKLGQDAEAVGGLQRPLPADLRRTHGSNVTSVFLSADGRYALSGSWDKTLKLWELPAATACGPSKDTPCGQVRFPECGRPLRPVGKRGQDAQAVGDSWQP